MDIRALIFILAVLIVIMLSDLMMKEDKISNKETEPFDISGIDSSQIQNISKAYNTNGSFTFGNVTASKFNLLPKNSIIMFKGSQVPVGWTLCNGQNGTPNLMGRIPMGDRRSGTLAGPALNATGSTNTAGNHSHRVNTSTRKYLNDAAGCCKKRRTVISGASSNASGNHSHTVSVTRVNSIYPDRTTVMFIMKL